MPATVLTDSTSYIKEEICKELGIRKVSLYVSFGDFTRRELEIADEEFYRLIEEKGLPTSSQPPPQEIYQEMKEAVERGDSLVGVFISSKMSGTYTSALTAKNMILEEYPEAQVEVIDSGSNSMQLGLAAIEGARAARAGKPFAEVIQAVRDCIKRTRFLFSPANLEYLKKGGRIGGAQALLASILKIVPVLTVENGVVEVVSKVRSRKKAVGTMLDILEEENARFVIEEAVVHHINVPDEARELAGLVRQRIGIEPDIVGIGPVISLHVGPGAVGVVYRTREPLRG